MSEDHPNVGSLWKLQTHAVASGDATEITRLNGDSIRREAPRSGKARKMRGLLLRACASEHARAEQRNTPNPRAVSDQSSAACGDPPPSSGPRRAGVSRASPSSSMLKVIAAPRSEPTTVASHPCQDQPSRGPPGPEGSTL